MHAIAGNTLRTARRPILRCTCRIVSGSQHPVARRIFHRSAISYRVPEKPGGTEGEDVPKENSKESDPDQIGAEDDVADAPSFQAVGESPITRKSRQGKVSSGRTSFKRPRQPEGLPPVSIPDWFLAKSVKCVEDADDVDSLAILNESTPKEEDTRHVNATTENPSAVAEIEGGNNEIDSSISSSSTNARYTIHLDVYAEIFATIKAGLALRPPRNTKSTLQRPHTVLQCPKDGGTYFLDSIVDTIAAQLSADLIRIDAQDIAQIIGPYVDENLAWTASTTSLLGYDAQKISGKLEEYEKESTGHDDSLGPEDEEDSMSSRTFRSDSPLPNFEELRKKYGLNSKKPGSLSLSNSRPQHGFVLGLDLRGTSQPANQPPSKSTEEQWRDLKISTALDALIGAADSKRVSFAETAGLKLAPSRDLIVQLKDFKDLSGTQEGPALLQSLQSAVNKRWSEGKNIILVGTSSTEDCGLSKAEIQHLQSDVTDGETRTIFVPPNRSEEQEIAFGADEKARVRQINVRHIEDMILKLADGDSHVHPTMIDIENELDNATAYSAGLEEAVWTFPRVHRLATTILGLDRPSKNIDGLIFTQAWKLLSNSDEAKFIWGAAELKQEDDQVDIMLKDMNDSSKKMTKERIKQIKKNCSPHERRLLGGVIMPSDIHTTFGDVHAPKETIEALKTLTSLQLIRPEAFSYGVLATDKIPGLLLYGPPGTGKTLLAKAVAKESGATVLEVSGAEVNDMYVGEGEKNVKAIFTLAKKLSPCVVFIDEADAIFAQRSDTRARSGTHRELINQFLREWDGMNDLSAFIMVATNRPFDLDEAVLRRLPRRLLVDLPVEKDREAILKIHLKDEVLDESMSLAALAKNTPYYSGSDLKNISVAAAFACIREENDMAAKHTGDEPFQFPEKRTLAKRHFDKALDEISASISEDMSTLAAIRKFDEKYGDRKGRRKKSSGLGFGAITVEEKDSEGGRVRKAKA